MHARTHTHTHHHQWNYNIFCSTPCMSDCYPVCWGPGLPQGESRVEPVTKPIYRSPETHTAEELLPPSHLIQPRPRQAPAGHALMTSSRLPLSAFRCGCHLKGVRGEISISGVQISALWCVHVLTEGGNEKKKRTSLPPWPNPIPWLNRGSSNGNKDRDAGPLYLLFTGTQSGRAPPPLHFRLNSQMHR